MKSQSGYWKAIGRHFDINQAVATAAPYSVSVLAYANSFLYNQGILCYRARHEIRLLDVHSGGKQERVLNLFTAFQLFYSEPPGMDAVDRVSLLQYSDDILVFRVDAGSNLAHDQTNDDQADLLSVFDMTRPLNSFTKRIPLGAQVFVRHSRTYLWYGIFREHIEEWTERLICEWTIYGVDLKTQNSVETFRVEAADSDLGQSICFEMYNEHLYAVSTQTTSSDVTPYSSFYHVFCCAPRDKLCPIFDLWTDLSIRIDETTGRPVILECRREHSSGGSENHRTYYVQPVPLPEECLIQHGERDTTYLAWNDLHEHQDSEYKDNEHRPKPRLPHEFHAEFASTDGNRKEFKHMSTRYHTYDLASSTFIELVDDRVLQPDGLQSLGCLRVRTISRKPKCPIDEEGTEGKEGLLFRPTQNSEDGCPIEGSEKRFITCGVHMWPPDNAPAELCRLLCPGTRIDTVRAISDERSLICSIKYPSLPAACQALILISFDPQISFPFLSSSRDMRTSGDFDKAFPFENTQPEVPNEDLLTKTEPLYEGIRLGYWLRRGDY
ncbi:hypothetical protein N7494_005355 [Penicillium frequentans]|uniref:Uncharacterized protein n=1 Tax=Penicillium frequentans TaxID=3151616 RepID=A0AAD6D0F4_9EURO|nr:hypothetical protein N7494_005355 [Penicillium glabrum]